MNSVLKTFLYSSALFTVLVLLIVCVTGCAPSDAWENEVSSLEYKILSSEKLNNYSLEFKIPSNDDAQSLQIIRQAEGGSSLQEVFNLDKGKDTFVDSTATPGVTYRYCLVESQDPDEILGAASIKIPHDITISESGTLSSIDTAGKIYIADGVELVTEGRPVAIRARELHAPKATIRAFASGKAAQPGVSSIDAGEIRIYAQKASGNLSIIADGENGAAGIAGQAGGRGVDGKNGRDGQVGVNPEIIPQLDARQLQYFKAVLEQRAFAPDILRVSFVFNNKPVYRCTVQAEAGENGTDGSPGQPGGNGGRGGDSAKVFVEIEEESPLAVSISSEPGHGGSPGIGGKGGAPGRGGYSGKSDWLRLGVVTPDGKTGNPGADGPPGRPGQPGSRSPACFYMAGRTIQGDLTSFTLSKTQMNERR